jgi:hypothetical protein
VLIRRDQAVQGELPIETERPPRAWRSYGNATTAGSAQVAAGLRRYLEARLPSFMIPSAFVALPSLPLLPSGKLDRAALPRPGGSREAAGGAFIPPAGPVETALAEIWAEFLRIPEVGSGDNFFALGGHSLLATQVVSRVRTRLQVDLPLRALFESPTIAGLAKVVAEMSPAAADSLAVLASTPSPATTAIDVEKLSDEEVDLLLAGLTTTERGALRPSDPA